MNKQKITIKVMLFDGSNKQFTVEGTIDRIQSKLLPEDKQVTDHDVASALFAIEFAANQNKDIPMRVHIEEVL